MSVFSSSRDPIPFVSLISWAPALADYWRRSLASVTAPNSIGKSTGTGRLRPSVVCSPRNAPWPAGDQDCLRQDRDREITRYEVCNAGSETVGPRTATRWRYPTSTAPTTRGKCRRSGGWPVIQPEGDNPYQASLFRFLGVFAQLKAEMAQQGTKEGIASRRQEDGYHHGHPPIGYVKRTSNTFIGVKTTDLVDCSTGVILDTHCSITEPHNSKVGWQVLKRNLDILSTITAAKGYDGWLLRNKLREEGENF